MAGKKKFIDDSKFDKIISDGWKKYQNAQKKAEKTGAAKKKVKRK
jgi:hypothetical protein